VTTGPFTYLSDPQYLGTSLIWFGNAVSAWSLQGMILGVIMYITFYISAVYVEGPHMVSLCFFFSFILYIVVVINIC